MAPTLVATYQAELTVAGTLVTPSFTPAPGEVLVVHALGSHSVVTFGATSGGGLAYTTRSAVATANYCALRMQTAVVGASPTAMTVSVPVSFTSGTAYDSSLVVERWSGAVLAATPATNAVKSGTTAQAQNPTITTSRADAAITWCAADWVPVTTGTVAFRSGAIGNYARRNTRWNAWSARQVAADAGAQTVGTSAPTGQKWTLLAVELLPAPVKVETVVDTFDGTGALASPPWTSVNGAGVQDDAMYVNASATANGPNYSSARTTNGYTFAGSSLLFRLVAVPAGDAYAQAWVRAITAQGGLVGRLGFEYRGAQNRLDLIGQTDAYAPIGQTEVLAPFDPVAHQWLLLIHNGTEVTWLTSSSGLPGSWTLRRTLPAAQVPAWAAQADLQLSFEAYRDVGGTNDTFRIDNLNAVPTGPPPRSLAVGSALEVDVAPSLTRARRLDLGRPGEANTVAPLARARRRDVGRALEVDKTPPVSTRRPGEVRTLREQDLALPLARARRRTVGATGESNTVPPLARTRTRAVGSATSLESTTPLARARRRDVGALAAELDAVRVLARLRALRIGITAEADTGYGIVARFRRRNVGRPTELEVVRVLARARRLDVGRGLEFDVMRSVFERIVVSDEAYRTALESAQRDPYATLLVDWDDSEYRGDDADLSAALTSISVERSLTGDLPDEAGLPNGFAAASLKADLGGYRAGSEVPIAAELSRYSPRSIRRSAPRVTSMARVEMGVVTEQGPKAERLFTGPVRSIAVSEGASTAKVDGVDPAERLRALITLPTFGEFITHASRRPWAMTTNSLGLIDHVLRKNGIFASPPPRDEAIVACTGHGALFSERGFNGAPISIYGTGPTGGKWIEDSHPYGLMGTSENSDGGTVGYLSLYGTTDGSTPPVRFEAGNGIGLSCLLHMNGAMRVNSGASFENRLFQIRPTADDCPRLFVSGFGNGDIYAGLTTAAGQVYGTPRIPTGSGPWRFFGVFFRWASNTSLVVTVRMDGQTRTYTLTVPAVTVTPTPFYDGYRAVLDVRAQLFRSWSNLQVWPSATAPPAGEWQGERHLPQADLRRGLNELVYLPDVSAVDSWDLLKDVVRAEYGVHGFSEFGRYFFRPRTDVRPSRIDHELDVAKNLADVGYSESSDSVRNVVGFTTARKYHAGVLSTVISARDPLQYVCEVGTTVFEVDWPWGAAGYQGGVLTYYPQKDSVPSNGIGFPADAIRWDEKIVHGWTYSTRGASNNWTINDNTRSVVVRWVQIDSRRARIRVTNPGPGPVRLGTSQSADGTNEGEGGLRIGGWPMVDVPDHIEVYKASSEVIRLHRGERGLPLPKTEWRQDPTALAPLARALLDALVEPAPALEDLPVRGDPRIKVGDVARLQFRDEAPPVVGTVVRTVHTLDRGGMRSQVSVRPLPEYALAPPGWSFYLDISHYQGEGVSVIDLTRCRSLGYAGCVIKVGQGAGTAASGDTYGATIDAWWTTFRDRSLVLWPNTTAGYWYVGNTESPAAQADRCAVALGDLTIPVMLDWEDAGGSWSNLLAVLSAFRSRGVLVTMLYTGRGYAAANGATAIDSTGLALVGARYWTNDRGDPRALWEDMPDGFGYEPFAGGTVDAHQFTQYGEVYPGTAVDVNSFPGSETALADMFHGR